MDRVPNMTHAKWVITTQEASGISSDESLEQRTSSSVFRNSRIEPKKVVVWSIGDIQEAAAALNQIALDEKANNESFEDRPIKASRSMFGRKVTKGKDAPKRNVEDDVKVAPPILPIIPDDKPESKEVFVTSVSMTIQNVDYKQLSADDHNELKGKLRETLARSAGVPEAAIILKLARGSVKVNAEIQTPDAHSAETIEKSLGAANLSDKVVEVARSLPSVMKAATGFLKVDHLEVKKVDVKDTLTRTLTRNIDHVDPQQHIMLDVGVILNEHDVLPREWFYRNNEVVQYYSDTHEQWVPGSVKLATVKPWSASYDVYDVKIFFSPQTRHKVPLWNLRPPLEEEDQVEYFTYGSWLPAVVMKSKATTKGVVTSSSYGYSIILTDSGTFMQRVPAIMLRPAFPEGSSVRVYLGLQHGWIEGTVVSPEEVAQEEPEMPTFMTPEMSSPMHTASFFTTPAITPRIDGEEVDQPDAFGSGVAGRNHSRDLEVRPMRFIFEDQEPKAAEDPSAIQNLRDLVSSSLVVCGGAMGCSVPRSKDTGIDAPAPMSAMQELDDIRLEGKFDQPSKGRRLTDMLRSGNLNVERSLRKSALADTGSKPGDSRWRFVPVCPDGGSPQWVPSYLLRKVEVDREEESGWLSWLW